MGSAWMLGAALVGLADALLSPELSPSPLRREILLVAVGGDLLGAAVVGLVLALLARLRLIVAPLNGSAFLMGAGLAAAPLLSQALDGVGLGIAAACALGVAIAAIGRGLFLPKILWRGGAVLAVGALAFGATRPSTLVPVLPAGPAAAHAAPDAEKARPDLLLISVDTLRADALMESTCTPNLARLRSRGLDADFALAPSSLTLPSHVTMLSGERVDEHGVTDNRGSVGDSQVWISERLRDHGYRTAAVVSNYLVRREAGFGRGVEVYDEAPIAHAGPVSDFRERVARATWWGWIFGELPPEFDAALYGDPIPRGERDRGNAQLTTAHALRLLRQLREQSEPYYLFVHYMDPHAPYVPPPASEAGSTAACEEAPALPKAYAGANADWRLLQRIARDLRAGTDTAEQARAHVRGLYQREVRYLDGRLGDLLDEVERGGRPTVVLLTADHGEQFGDHGLMAHGDSVYESSLRVPFLLAGPGIHARRLEHPPHLLDVAPTLLSLAGVSVDKLPGLDLSRRDPGPRPHLARAGPHAALRDERGFKWVVKLDAKGGRLYALARDPGETRDLRSSEPELAARLEKRLRERATIASGDSLPHNEEHLSALRALGYIDD